MTLDELQTAWQATDAHLRTTQHLQQRLVHTLVQQTSHGRLAALQRKLTGQALLLAALTPLLLASILRWNPFGLRTWYGLAPLLLWAASFGVAGLLTWQERQRVARLTLASANLREALTLVISAQRRYLALLGWVSWLGVLFIFLLNAARTTEHLSEMSLPEIVTAYGATLLFAGLFSHWAWRRQWPRATRTYLAELHTWQAELAELDALAG